MVVLAALLTAWVAAQDPAVEKPGLTPAQMAEDLRQLAKETAAKWAYAEDRKQTGGLDLPAQAEALIARLGEVKSDADFVGLVREFVAALRDGHAWFTWQGVERLPFRRWPITVREVAEGLMVDAVLPTWSGKPAATAGKALILDLRGNGGGTDLLGMEVAACLLPAGSVYYGLSSRSVFGWWSAPGFHELAVEGAPPRFAGKLVVLIDEACFSTTDNLCRCLDDLHPDVTFVGRPTGGGTGAPRPSVTLRHSGVVVGFCTMRVFGPKGELIEGRGTRPDLPVKPTRDDVLAGRDADLEAGLRLVR